MIGFCEHDINRIFSAVASYFQVSVDDLGFVSHGLLKIILRRPAGSTAANFCHSVLENEEGTTFFVCLKDRGYVAEVTDFVRVELVVAYSKDIISAFIWIF
jgi:hypothetical protein